MILEAIVDEHGRVTDVKVLRTAGPLLDDEAAAALRQWRYAPLTLNGIKV
jgi:TonB family protein